MTDHAGTYLRSYLGGMQSSIWPGFKPLPGRLFEVDVCRGIAILIMVVYHLMWNLRNYAGYDINVQEGFWGYWQEATVGLFAILVGVSLTLSYRREREIRPVGSLWPKYLVRGATILTWGLLVTLVTYLTLGPDRFVRFGILHLIGVSIALAYPLLQFRWLNLALAAVVIGLGLVMDQIRPDLPWLSWLVRVPDTGGVDYAPVIPMLSRVLIGVFLGNLLQPQLAERLRSSSTTLLGTRSKMKPAWSAKNPAVRVLERMGQNSLLIYFVHQPILIGLLFLVGAGRL